MNYGAEPQGLRERKKLKARRELERVALELFERKGFDETTIREIADAADMSPRTFFRYFRSKEEVIFAHASEDTEALRACLAAQPPTEGAYESVRRACIDWADHLQEGKEQIVARARLTARTGALRRRAAEIQDHAAAAIADDLSRRRAPADDASAALVASVCLQTLTVAVAQWRRGNFDRPLREYVSDSFRNLEREIRLAVPLTGN